MTEEPKPGPPRGRLFRHEHKKRSLRAWVIPLLLILAVIVFLPRLVALLDR